MLTINIFKTYRLRAAAHLKTMQRFYDRVKTVAFAHSAFAGYLKAFEDALAKEDADFKKQQGSDITAQIQEADQRRDRAYGTLITIIRSMAQGLGTDEQTEAATKLLRIFNTYKVDVSAQMDQQSGLTEQLCQDIDKSGIDMAVLSLTKVYEELKAANALVDQLLDARDDERTSQEVGALKADRVAVDEAYANLTMFVNAMVVLHPTDEIVTFVKQWNTVVNRVRQQILKTSAANGGDVDVDIDTPADGEQTEQPGTQQGGQQQGGQPTPPAGGEDDTTFDP